MRSADDALGMLVRPDAGAGGCRVLMLVLRPPDMREDREDRSLRCRSAAGLSADGSAPAGRATPPLGGLELRPPVLPWEVCAVWRLIDLVLPKKDDIP